MPLSRKTTKATNALSLNQRLKAQASRMAERHEELPGVNAPTEESDLIQRSYKIDLADRTSWWFSEDGGKSKKPLEPKSLDLIGIPMDFAVVVTEAQQENRDYDHRLRLMFSEQLVDQPIVAELNLNAMGCSRDDEIYIPTTARSLLGSLFEISESEDDMRAFMRGAKFTLKKGTRSARAAFIGISIAAENGNWISMSNAQTTNHCPKNGIELHNFVRLIHSRFRNVGLLEREHCVLGEGLESFETAYQLKGQPVALDTSQAAQLAEAEADANDD